MEDIYAMVPVQLRGVYSISKYGLEEFIEEKKQDIKRIEQKILRNFFITEPLKFCDTDQDPEMKLQRDFDDIFEDSEYSLRSLYTDLYKAELILEHWDEMHFENGLEKKYIETPRIDYETAVVGKEDNGRYYPVGYDGNFLSKDSNEIDIRRAFNRVDKLQDGTTKAEWMKEH